MFTYLRKILYLAYDSGVENKRFECLSHLLLFKRWFMGDDCGQQDISLRCARFGTKGTTVSPSPSGAFTMIL